jgi:type III secretion protein J
VHNWRVLITAGAAAMFAAACGTDTIVQKINEREANEILEVLDEANIPVNKGVIDTGRDVFFSIQVPSNQRIKAIKILNQYNLPRPRDKGYNEVFGAGSSGLIPTNTEERAKLLQALEGEIQSQLKLVDGILDAQVNIVMPQEDALRTTKDIQSLPSASVTIKYMPTASGAKPLSEPQVQAIVAAAVEKLTADRVVVVMTPGGGAPKRADTDKGEKSRSGFWGLPTKQLNMVAVVVLVLVLLMAVGLVYAQVRIRTVRGRLIRLQGEIAKARRKPGDSVVSGPPSSSQPASGGTGV